MAIRSGSRRDFRGAPYDLEESAFVGPHGFAVALGWGFERHGAAMWPGWQGRRGVPHGSGRCVVVGRILARAFNHEFDI